MTLEKTTRVDLQALVTAISINSKFTSAEASALVDKLASILQFCLLEGVPVEVPGIGILSANGDKAITFEPAPALVDILRRKEIRIESKHGLTNTDLSMLGEWIYKHRVPVC